MSTFLSFKSERAGQCGRVIMLFILAGLLFLRQEFSHRSLGEIPFLWGGSPWKILECVYISELLLLLLFPLAVIEFFRIECERSSENINSILGTWGWPFVLASAFVGWGGLHALYACLFSSPCDMYLMIRQSALAAYGLFFIYGLIFFGRDSTSLKYAVWFAFGIGVLTAGVDFLADFYLNPLHPEMTPRWALFFRDKPYGQETLIASIIGSMLLVISTPKWHWKVFFLSLCAFVGWRQGLRFQSVVPMAVGGAIFVYAIFGIMTFRKQIFTLRRVGMVLVLMVLAGVGYGTLRPSAPEDKAEVGAWGWKPYADLFDCYDRVRIPSNPAEFVFSTRGRGLMSNPEVYRLNAVFKAGKNTSVRNNMWRFLVWRQMASDWQNGHWLVGSGVGKPWFYDALFDTPFHYGEDRLGLDPHNSFLNTLYRFGAVGLLLLLALIVSVSWKVGAVLRSTSTGDLVLECLIFYFFYTVVFSNFTVALEGPAYAMPFWFSMALLYARSRHVLILESRELNHE